jgi:hypothetical protein
MAFIHTYYRRLAGQPDILSILFLKFIDAVWARTMTVIIGMTSSGIFLPPASEWSVQPCVVVAADTRISYDSGPRYFGVKIDHVGRWAIVGYSGDAIFGNRITAELDDYASEDRHQKFDDLLLEAESLRC